MNADYMDFMNVASAVREKTVNALNSVEDLEGFAKHIGVMDWQGAGRGREEGRVSSLLDMEMVEQHCPSKQEKSRGFRKSQQPKRGPRTQMNMGHRATSPSPVLARMGGLGNSQQRSTGDLLGGGGGLAGSMGGGGETKSFDASLLSDNVNLDIFVQLANQSTQLSVSRMSSIKDVVENVTRTLKKKMKKPKKGEIQALYNTVTGIWLDDQRKVWSYLLKDNDKLELKCKPPSLQTRKVDIEIHLESSTFNQPVHYLGESTVFGVIQAIDKPKSVLEKIHLYGLFLGSDGGRGDVWLDESRTLASYGLNDSKLKFSLRSNKEDSTSSASSRAQAPLPPSSASTPSHIAGGWALPQAPAAATPAPAAGGWASSTSPSTSSSSSPRDPPLSSSPSLPAPISPSQRAQAPLPPSTSKELESWTVNEVVEWVKGLGLGEHAGAFERGRVDGKTLSEMTGPNLRTLGIQALGTRKEILRQVKSAKGE
uniref:SAM domain-containing protein n=1 Tax=Paramoeba aestuarina TaxID=180227 RepID=A0A7S4N826_9EUKA